MSVCPRSDGLPATPSSTPRIAPRGEPRGVGSSERLARLSIGELGEVTPPAESQTVGSEGVRAADEAREGGSAAARLFDGVGAGVGRGVGTALGAAEKAAGAGYLSEKCARPISQSRRDTQPS